METTVAREEKYSELLAYFTSLLSVAFRSEEPGRRAVGEFEPMLAQSPALVRTVRASKGVALALSAAERLVGEGAPAIPLDLSVGFLSPSELEELVSSAGDVEAVRVVAEDGVLVYGVSRAGRFLLVDNGSKTLILVEPQNDEGASTLSLSLYAVMAAHGLESVESARELVASGGDRFLMVRVEKGQLEELWNTLKATLKRLWSTGSERALPRELDNVRRKILALVGELRELLGQTRDTASEWPVLLVFGLLAGVDPVRPPMTIHVVGEIGTFKTTAPTFLARALRTFSIVARCRCKSPRDKYEELLGTLEEWLGITRAELDRRVGGLITRVKSDSRTLEVGLSLLHLLSLSARRREAGNLLQLVEDLAKRGFTVSLEEEPVSVKVFSHQEIANLEDYKFKYIPDPELGVLQVADAFGSHIAVVDEGSRDPYALEALLTKMSYTTQTDTVRLIVVTDNIEPFMNVATDQRYDPVHDRALLAVTRPSFSIPRAIRARSRLPTTALTLEELLAVRHFLDSISVPDHILVAVLIASNLLSFQFTLGSVEGRGIYARLLERGANAPVKFDFLSEEVGVRARFIGGGRFVFHTLLLARFFAFMEGKATVGVKHVARALFYTARSRTVPEGVDSYYSYRAASVKLALAVARLVEELVSEEGLAFVALKAAEDLVKASRGDTSSAERVLKVFRDLTLKPTHASLATLITILDLALAEGLEDMTRLPDLLKYALADYLLVRGDPSELIDSGIPESIVHEILEQRKAYTTGK